MKFLPMARVVLLFCFGIPAFATTQETTSALETFQATVVLTATNDPVAIFSSGSVQLTGNRILVRFGMPNCVGSSGLYGPAGDGTNAPQLLNLPVFPNNSADGPGPACFSGGEFGLSAEQTAQVRSGLWYVQMDGYRGQIIFDHICRFSATNEVEFTATIIGWNPTNRQPRYLRFGRATFGLTGDVLSYEIQMPSQFGPYFTTIKGPGRRGYVDVAEMGTLDCPAGTGMGLPPDATELELLPACVMRGAICVPQSRLPNLLAGQYIVVLNSYAAWGQISAVDLDQDGVPDFLDHCPNTPPGAVIDANGCSIEQLAPCEGPWRNHGEYVNRVKDVTAEFLNSGLLSESQRKAIMDQASQSRCGQNPKKLE